jgi:hypothetical protein
MNHDIQLMAAKRPNRTAILPFKSESRIPFCLYLLRYSLKSYVFEVSIPRNAALLNYISQSVAARQPKYTEEKLVYRFNALIIKV